MYEPLEIYTRNALTRCFLKVITLGLFNTALQIHVQISVYAMFRVTSKNEEVDFQRLLSIALSIASASFLLIHVQKVLLYAGQALLKVEQVMEHINETDEPVTWRDLKNYFVWRAAEARVIRYREYVRWSTAAFVLAVSLAIMKLCMAFRCPDALWNIGSMHSCVDLETVFETLYESK